MDGVLYYYKLNVVISSFDRSKHTQRSVNEHQLNTLYCFYCILKIIICNQIGLLIKLMNIRSRHLLLLNRRF